jgi:uncharacterized protein with HEPN domain
MVVPTTDRLRHIKQSIEAIRRLLRGQTVADVRRQPDTRAAVERYLEIISEASRHIPEAWKSSFGPEVPWWEVAAFGNILRHEYEQVDISVLWSVYSSDVDPLEAAIDAMLAAHSPKDASP